MRIEAYLEGLRKGGYLTAAEVEFLKGKPREIVVEQVLRRFDTAAWALSPYRRAGELLDERLGDEPVPVELAARLNAWKEDLEAKVAAHREQLRRRLQACEF